SFPYSNVKCVKFDFKIINDYHLNVNKFYSILKQFINIETLILKCYSLFTILNNNNNSVTNQKLEKLQHITIHRIYENKINVPFLLQLFTMTPNLNSLKIYCCELIYILDDHLQNHQLRRKMLSITSLVIKEFLDPCKMSTLMNVNRLTMMFPNVKMLKISLKSDILMEALFTLFIHCQSLIYLQIKVLNFTNIIITYSDLLKTLCWKLKKKFQMNYDEKILKIWL
ncbi:unnamed protein product, partial [Didymodactylos carnosus]